MATEKLFRAVVSGPVTAMDEAIRSLMLDREFQPLQASTTLGGRGELQVPDCDDIYRPALESAVALLGKLGIQPAFRDFRNAGYTLENCQSWLSESTGEVARLTTKRNSAVSLAHDDAELIGRLEPFSLLEVDLEELLDMKSMRIHFGSTQIEFWDALRAEAETEYGAFLFRSGFDTEKIYCILLTLPGTSVMAEERLCSAGLQLEEIPNAAGLTGIPAERIAALRTEAEEARRQGEELTKQLQELAAKMGVEALARYSFLKYMSEGAALRRMAGTDGDAFFICGWLPAGERDGFKAAAEALGCTCRVEKPGVLDQANVPVKLKKGRLAQVFAPFVDMYGVPAYGEADPRLFLALTYCLFFGMMFGDIGQGVVLILVGLYMYKKRGMWLGGILACVGVPAILFGCIYGSVFGNEHILPGFKVLEGDGVVTILLVSAAIGILLILLTGIINIITCFRQREYRKAVFSANGITGVLFLALLIAGVVLTMALSVPVFSSAVYWIVLAVLLLTIWFSEPLALLLHLERKHDEQHSLGMMILEGFFELFEAVLSWLSNCLSFLRVGTYAVIHAIMMMIVYQLSAQADGGYSIFGLVIGNAIVMVIEAALVCIQSLRLEFYELFSRFYTGRGTSFEPAVVDYSSGRV